MRLVELGVLERYGVEVIGARPEAIATAEDRDRFKAAMQDIGLEVPPLGLRPLACRRRRRSPSEIGFPIMVRPSFILGGKGTGIAEDRRTASRGWPPRAWRPARSAQILVERSIAGWKEFELEVMRDGADNCVVVCSIENFDPMGVHTGDSITVAPAQTLTDVEYQAMRDDAFACLRRVGVETGGSNVQFAVDPATGRRVIIEMNPRVSRSSALASKATGFPDRQDRRPSGRRLPPRRDPQRHHAGDAGLASSRPSTTWSPRSRAGPSRSCPGPTAGSAPACSRWARSWPSAARSASRCRRPLRSLEQGRAGLNADPAEAALDGLDDRRAARAGSAVATPDRVFELEAALRRGVGRVDEVVDRTGIDPWFVRQIERASLTERRAHRRRAPVARSRADAPAGRSGSGSPTPSWPTCAARPRPSMRAARLAAAACGATFKTVDTCAAEFEAFTPYHYATYEEEDEVRPSERARVDHPRARVPTASGRGSSSTTAACTRPWRCATPATRR